MKKALGHFVLVLALALVLGLAPGCGGDDDAAAPVAPTSIPAAAPVAPTPTPTPAEVVVNETKTLEINRGTWKGDTEEIVKWEVTLVEYAWQGDRVGVYVSVANVGQTKGDRPSLEAIDAGGNRGEALVLPKDSYPYATVWPGQRVSGFAAWQFGPLSQGVKLRAYQLFYDIGVEFSLGR